MKLYFARHGESEANVLHVISNRGYQHGLTARGREQAARLAGLLEDAEISSIFTSPLMRAVQTTEIIADKLGLAYTITDALREYDCGILEGKSNEESWRQHGDIADAWVVHKNWAYKADDGESFFDIRDRFVPFIERFTYDASYAGKNILLVGHGGTFRMMLPLIFTNVDTALVEAHPLNHTTCIIAEHRATGFQCLQWGDITFSYGEFRNLY